MSTTDHPIHAFLYDPVMGLLDRAGLGDRRRRLLAEARGEVVEVGGGTGRNLPYYRDVARVVVLEPDGAMRARLLTRVDASAVPVEVHEVGIEESGLPDGFADTVVASLVLCTVASPEVALAEIRRLLRPDGRLLFLEHVRSPGLRGRLESAVSPVWARTVGAGCHLDRPTLDSLRSAGFAITDCHRSGALVQGIAVPSSRFPLA
ncbi:MAG TPA: class I SAM-dependent methyltransferase [Acidimicrobiales bacterium]|nr:class I SAM-dependent methyltransferase [Acidimicrobiales bacterium]